MNEARRQPIRNPSAPRILVVEDDADIASLLICNLKAEGYFAESVQRGDEAELRLTEFAAGSRHSRLDAAGRIRDRNLFRLRARDETRNLPVIMLTARGKEAERVRGFSAGADDYVVKPFSVARVDGPRARPAAAQSARTHR